MAWLAVDLFGGGKLRGPSSGWRTISTPRRAGGAKKAARGKKKNDAMARMLEASAPAWPSRCSRKPRRTGQAQAEARDAGFRSEAAPQIFLGTEVRDADDRRRHRRRHDDRPDGPEQGSIFRVVMIAGVHVLFARASSSGGSPKSAKKRSSWACPTRST